MAAVRRVPGRRAPGRPTATLLADDDRDRREPWRLAARRALADHDALLRRAGVGEAARCTPKPGARAAPPRRRALGLADRVRDRRSASGPVDTSSVDRAALAAPACPAAGSVPMTLPRARCRSASSRGVTWKPAMPSVARGRASDPGSATSGTAIGGLRARRCTVIDGRTPSAIGAAGRRVAARARCPVGWSGGRPRRSSPRCRLAARIALASLARLADHVGHGDGRAAHRERDGARPSSTLRPASGSWREHEVGGCSALVVVLRARP